MTEADLDLVFGPGSGSQEARAKASSTRYVRSQVQLALFTDGARGRVLSAYEALQNFGFEALLTVHRDGSFPLIWKDGEPAATLKVRREDMGVSTERLARAAGVNRATLEKGERPNQVIPIRDLEKLSQFLALDETVIGYAPRARGDNLLSVRLRQLKEARDEIRFTEGTVLKLAEAAWVIARQAKLAEILGETPFSPPEPDYNFSYPSWKQGFRLAATARLLMNLGPSDPIQSLRALLEQHLRIPFVQQDLGQRFAGATLSNGSTRGIVVNEQGANSNVWVRRMTLCHELGHLLWDPDQQLNKLKVDTYEELQGNFSSRADPVEIRANAFAVSFLAPPDAVRSIFDGSSSDQDALFTVSEKFGISITASRFHASNILGRDIASPEGEYPRPGSEWEVAENLAVDFFPIATTPITRRGHFSFLVAKAYLRGLLTDDSAASMLASTPEVVRERATQIVDLVR